MASGRRMEQADPMEPKRVAFVCAMPMELVPLTRDLGLAETEVGGVALHSGTLDDREVVAIVTGMGTELARTGVERLLDAVAVDHVFVVGITGALENDTPIGTLVLPEIVVDSATGREHRHEPLGDAEHHGRMWTTDGLTTDVDVLAELRDQGVVSLDMETAAIAHECEARGIPWSVFRAISDRASDGSVDVEVFAMSNQDGTPNHEAITAYFEKYPERIPLLARMAEDSTLATERAAAAAIRACADL
jgi:adenosylhomocysteine nucleosidase